MVALELTILSAGYCRHPEFVTIKGGRWGPCSFPSLFALIKHPSRGYLLYDTGYAPHLQQQARHWTGKLYLLTTPLHLGAQDSAAAQLRAQNIDPGEIQHIFISHFHGDHIAGLRDFPNARFWCFRDAWFALRGRTGFGALKRGFLPGLLPADFEARLQFVDPQAVRDLPGVFFPFERAYDLFGDGSLQAIPLPGHATGQMGLLLSDGDGRPTFLIADACWSEQAYLERRPPHAVTRLIMADHQAYLATLEKLHILAQRHPALRLIPSHSRRFSSVERP